MWSTDSFTILNTFTVPSISMTLLPIAIITVPKNTQLFSSISVLPNSGVMKSICSNSRDSFETDLLKEGGVIAYTLMRALSDTGAVALR